MHIVRSYGSSASAIYSKDREGRERFIEVKHFSDKESSFELKPHQLKKAELEGDKYYVCVVKGLREGITPKLFIIQNPFKWLSPDPPVRHDYSEWKNAVKEEIDFSKS